MRTETLQTQRYIAADGAVFAAEKDCLAYEATLPREVLFKLENKPPVGSGGLELYEYGYIRYTSREVWDDPAFLREGGWRTEADQDDVSLGFAFGTYDDLVRHAVKNDEFWGRRNQIYIRVIKFAVLSKRAYETVFAEQSA